MLAMAIVPNATGQNGQKQQPPARTVAVLPESVSAIPRISAVRFIQQLLLINSSPSWGFRKVHFR